MAIKVKAEHKDVEIGFNNSTKPLGERNDLHILLEAATANNYKHILDMFEDVSDDALQKEKENAFNQKQASKSEKSTNAKPSVGE